MSTYREIIEQRNSTNGVDVTTNWRFIDDAGQLDFTIKDVDYNLDAIIELHETVDYIYGADGRLSGELLTQDTEGNGTVDWQSTRVLTYDANGRVSTDTNSSLDFNGNSLPDYSDTTTHVYDAAGRVTSKETVWSFDGTPNGIDYRLESMTYNAKGLLATHFVDDWSLYDFIVGKQYTYDSAGRVTKVKTMDPFVFGDEAWHNAETYKYSGSKLIESNKYDEFVNGVHVLEDKAKFTFNSSNLVSKEKHTGQDANWHTITGYQHEFWYDSSGRLDTQLTSFDIDGNNVMEVGTRTLQEFSYNADGSLATHTIDTTTGDNILEYSYLNQLVA